MFRHYDSTKYDPNFTFELPPEGEHILRVEKAKWTTSKNGNDMIEAVFSVEGCPSRIYHYFVDHEYIQKKLDSFFTSFGIEPGDFHLEGWVGRRGAARVRHKEDSWGKKAEVWYFVTGQGRSQEPAGTPGDGKPMDAYEAYAEDFPLEMSDFDGLEDGEVPF
jgi:hypothetical protein